MDFSEEWKSLWPISAVFSAPLLLPVATQRHQSPVSKRPRTEIDDTLNCHKDTGPLVFIPNPDKQPSLLFYSPTLSPRLPPPYPNLSFKRFLSTSGPFLPLSTASHIAKEFRSNGDFITADDIDDPRNHMHAFNSLQLLPCSSVEPSSSVVAFFPTGENCDQVGYLMLRPKESELMVQINSVNDNVFVANEKLNSRILKLLVIPVAAFDDSFSDTTLSTPTFPVIGYVMACSMYSVYWFAVKTMRHSNGFAVKSIRVDCLGSRLFRSCAVVDSCWNPHLSEECLVLLETGELYLFDLTSCLNKPSGSKKNVQGRRLQISGNKDKKVEKASGLFWFGCVFSWHPRIFIIAHSSAVFLVDARFETYVVSCLLKIEMLSNLQNDGFVALSRDNTDGFRFCVSSKRMLFLCDLRQPLRPLLRWAHNIENPRYLTIFKLSELRSNAKDVTYEWASEEGSCVLLGSFWDCEFNLFVFGPNTNNNPVTSEISKFCNSMYAWGVPSELSLLGINCYCGWRFVREEAFKESLPDWIDWRHKKDLVLGFSILHGENFVGLSKPENNGGFLLIRLMSSGKLEAQSYHAVWEFPKNCEIHSNEWNCVDSPLYDKDNNHDYQGVKFQYLDFPFFDAYLKGNLDEIILKKIRQIHYTKNGGDAATMSGKRDIFKDINFPTSLREITLKSIYASLHSFFSCQSDFPGVLSYLTKTDGNLQFPFPFRTPSSYSTRLSHKIPLDELGDTFLPPQFLLNLRSRIGSSDLERNANPDEEIERECCRVTEMAESPLEEEDHVVSLCDDVDDLKDFSENTTKLKLLFHKPSCETKDSMKFVYLKLQDTTCSIDAKMDGFDLLDRGSPLELQFDSNVVNFEEKELKQFQLLKKHDLKFQKGFHLYQEYLSKPNLR